MAPEAFDAAPVAAHTRSRVLARDGAEIARIESAFVALASYLRTTPLTARDENTISELISHIADKRACAQAPAPVAHNAALHESTAHSQLRSALTHYLETRSISSFFARLSSAGVANLLDPETRNEAKQCFNVATRAAIYRADD
jgi:predicted DNA-binding ribbon-helix-helix protein